MKTTPLIAFTALTLLTACSSPFEYNTYETGKTYEKSLGNKVDWKFWQSEERFEDEENVPVMLEEEPMSEPLDITVPQGRV